MSRTDTRWKEPVRAMIAAVAQHAFATGPDRPPLMPEPANVESIECFVKYPNELMIRVKTTDKGMRYFTLQIRENK